MTVVIVVCFGEWWQESRPVVVHFPEWVSLTEKEQWKEIVEKSNLLVADFDDVFATGFVRVEYEPPRRQVYHQSHCMCSRSWLSLDFDSKPLLVQDSLEQGLFELSYFGSF